MTCHSGGTLEIYVEPYLPTRSWSWSATARSSRRSRRSAAPPATPWCRCATPSAWARLDALGLGRRASVVVATHADSDEDALERVLRSRGRLRQPRRQPEADRGDPRDGSASAAWRPSAWAASRRRPGSISAPSRRWRSPSASWPRSSSTTAATRRWRPSPRSRRPRRRKRIDPICGMTVEIATARHRSEAGGRTTYFCCAGCKATFEQAS